MHMRTPDRERRKFQCLEETEQDRWDEEQGPAASPVTALVSTSQASAQHRGPTPASALGEAKEAASGAAGAVDWVAVSAAGAAGAVARIDGSAPHRLALRRNRRRVLPDPILGTRESTHWKSGSRAWSKRSELLICHRGLPGESHCEDLSRLPAVLSPAGPRCRAHGHRR